MRRTTRLWLIPLAATASLAVGCGSGTVDELQRSADQPTITLEPPASETATSNTSPSPTSLARSNPTTTFRSQTTLAAATSSTTAPAIAASTSVVTIPVVETTTTTAAAKVGEIDPDTGLAVPEAGATTTTTTPVATTVIPVAAPTVSNRPPAPPASALTGPYASSSNRPALVVKIDNASKARPQSGLTRADMVFEVRVESATRFLAVYQSENADTVGPVRSARTTDVGLLGVFGQPLFSYSGANDAVRASVTAAAVTDVGGYTNSSAYRRSTSRGAPHNLYSSTDRLFAAGGSGAVTSPFTFRGDKAAAPGSSPIAGISVNIDGGPTRFVWSEAHDGWLRFQGSSPTRDANGGLVVVENVVVLEMTYRPSVADSRSPEAVSIGSGGAKVLGAGAIIDGTWNRPSNGARFALADGSGSPTTLMPGRSWIILPKPGTTAAISAASAANLLARV